MQANAEAPRNLDATLLKAPKQHASLQAEEIVFGLLSGGGKWRETERKWGRDVANDPVRVEAVLMAFRRQGCSEVFARKLLHSPELRQRTAKLAESFVGAGEYPRSLEELEITCELFDPGKEDIGAILKELSFDQKIPGLRNITPAELRFERLKGMISQVFSLPADSPDRVRILQLLDEAFQGAIPQVLWQQKGAQSKGKDWYVGCLGDVLATQDIAEKFFAHEPLKQTYKQATGHDIHLSHRKLIPTWKTNADGTRVPTMKVESKGVNNETKRISTLGFDLEREERKTSDGDIEKKRVMKEIIVVIDSASRDGQGGMQFMLDKLSLVRRLNIQEALFNANIQIGSYVWRKIADVDVRAMAEVNFEDREWEHLGGPGMWDQEKEKKARLLLMRNFIGPVYFQQMEEALTRLSPDWKAHNPDVLARLNSAMVQIQEKINAGTATMEELGDVGMGENIFSFNEDGDLLPLGTESRNKGHLGKAALMGLPWMARVKLDLPSLSQLIDRLHKGSALKSAAMKMGLVVKSYL